MKECVVSEEGLECVPHACVCVCVLHACVCVWGGRLLFDYTFF